MRLIETEELERLEKASKMIREVIEGTRHSNALIQRTKAIARQLDKVCEWGRQ